MGYGGIIGQQFDGYTQNQTLTQAVAALYGLGTDAVPNDVFNILSKSALYKTAPTTGLYTPTDQLIMSIPSMGFSPASVITGSYVGTGTTTVSIPVVFQPKSIFVYGRNTSHANEDYFLTCNGGRYVSRCHTIFKRNLPESVYRGSNHSCYRKRS